MKTPHPYAEILRAIADGETVQWLSEMSSEWRNQSERETLREIDNRLYPPDRYRVKPRTIRVGEVDVPEPMREEPAPGTPVFFADARMRGFVSSGHTWCADLTMREWLERGLCYSNPTDAEIAGRAIAALFAKGKP